MNRYNIFYQVHKGLRALLFETGNWLQQADFSQEEGIAGIVERVNELVYLFDRHAHAEDSIVLPAIASYEPAVADAFEEEHRKDHDLALRLEKSLSGLLAAGNDKDRVAYGKHLNVLFAEFIAFNLAHMAKEETVVNGLLWRYYRDEELLQLTRKIVAGQSPGDLARMNKWMLRGLNDAEIIVWLKKVKNEAPDHVFGALMTQVEEELTARRWGKIQGHLAEGLLLA